ncbi:MAG: inositol-3-phosphate synthase [Candidatus Aenigmarchaeota archaeon]|nr:inositol-3-phosphate synthase [Candidatus Aenigmarchaeota archaeon]
MAKIKVAIAGVGNCAAFLLQCIEYYRGRKELEIPGVLYVNLGGYHISDIEPVAAFDVDSQKVGKDLAEVLNHPLINTEKIAELPRYGVEIQKGPVLDGIGNYLGKFVSIDTSKNVADVAKVLQESGAEVLLNYLPVGSYEASRFYADVALKAGCAFVNCIPEFIASDKDWARKFEEKKLPIIGDDVKGQLGASILSRTLVKLFADRGGKLERMYQLNYGGNTDFINLLEHSRLKFKKISKTETIQSQLIKRLPDDAIHIGPSDYVPWLKSRKVAHIRMEGKTFGDIPIIIDARLDVEDKSVSAGVIIDAIRCAKLAMERGIGGQLLSPSAYFMKMPPQQYPDPVAKQMLEEFIRGERER